MTPTATPVKKNLILRMLRRGLVGFSGLAALLFLPAGSLRFWQGWALVIMECSGAVCFCIYFYRRDPQVLERRLLRKEKLNEQKLIILLWKALGALSVLLAGYDYRFGWSRACLRPVPVWLELLSLLLILCGYILHFQVLKANRFAASIIQTETGQSVAVGGPYSLIRHPMYFEFAVMGLFRPLALGSFIALPISVLIIPLIIFRLLNEEKFLRRDLAGYPDYCQQTRYRLIPFVW
jgi:protein-S-isoprenylcysteine O-methyltransferase Ste14